MTLYVFPYAPADARAVLAANAARWPAGTTYSEKFPTQIAAAPHIQYAWDGTPTQESNREKCVVRITVWGWRTQTAPGTFVSAEDAPANLASLVQAVFLDSGSTSVWRYTRGTGRLTGTDPATKIPFCTFTLTAETRPSPVA